MVASSPRRALVIPAVMVAVALFHAGRVVSVDQSSWQGAGFGMFATYDFDGTRAVVAVASVGEEEVQLSLEMVPPDLQRLARVAPTDATLIRIAELLRGVAPPETSAVRVGVRGPRLDDGTVRYEVLNDVVIHG